MAAIFFSTASVRSIEAPSGIFTPAIRYSLSLASREAFISSSTERTFTMSCTGTPSVTATMTRTPAPAASRIASPAKGGGTKIMLAVAPVARTASRTVSKIARPLGSFVPPLPGVTPPTIFVP